MNDMANGQGKFISKQGKQIIGEWMDNRLVKITS